MNARPAATVVVVPRERFSEAAASLASIVRHTAPPDQLVYVDGASPAPVRRAIAAAAARHGFRVLRRRHYLSPNEARNLGLAAVDTPYVVFVDNDLHVRPGWLGALVQCAEQTGAWLVGPLYHQGRPGAERIHMAGGVARIEERDGRRFLRESHHLSAGALEDGIDLRRSPTELIEFHCLLARTQALRDLGGLDPRLLNTPEHVDLCLSANAAGGGIQLEPAAKVTYVGPGPLRLYDLPYFLLRWSDDWTRRSLAHFGRKWRLADDDPFLREHAAWCANYRRSVSHRWRHVLRRGLGARAAQPVEGWLERAVTAWAASAPTVHTPEG